MYSAFAASARFPHRVNQNGTIDSICSRCYLTIGTSTLEADLAAMESAHVCDPAILKHYQGEINKMPPSGEDSMPKPSRRRNTGL